MSTPITFLALGDSYTIGEGVMRDERWPVRLTILLRETGNSVSDPDIVARTGWTTDELMSGIREAQLKESYGLVSLLIGVNNQYRGRSVEQYAAEFRELLNHAVERAGGDERRVLVLSIPDWGVTPFAEGRDRSVIAAEIDEFNAVNRAEAERRGASYVDVTAVSRAGEHRKLLVADGLHPAAAMYDIWARLAVPAAQRAIAALLPDRRADRGDDSEIYLP
jgi:lysophospholipase L1-like esterase